MLLALLRCQKQIPSFPLQFRSSIQSRQFSQSVSRAFLRPSRFFRQELENKTANANANQELIDSYTARGPSFYNTIAKPRITKQLLFTYLASSFAFMTAIIVTDADTEWWEQAMVASSPIWSVKTITNADLKRTQHNQVILGLRKKLSDLQSTVQQLPLLVRPWVNLALVSALQTWADAAEGKRLCWKICLLNIGIFAAWKVRGLRGFMNRAFMHNPLSGASYTLLTSTFSHRTFLHLLCNCLALESFGTAAHYYLSREQDKAEMLESTSSYHFLAFFVTAGMFSGLVSHIVNAKFRYPRLVAQLASSANATKKTETWASAVAATTASAAAAPAKKKVLDILPSLGASGAIYAAVTMTALAFPDSEVALFIPPSFPINIQYGVGGLLMLDVIGIIRGWRMFDHWAHLGGAAFGVFYFHIGPSAWSLCRVAEHEQRKSMDPRNQPPPEEPASPADSEE